MYCHFYVVILFNLSVWVCASYKERYNVSLGINDGSLGDEEACDGLRIHERKPMNHEWNLQTTESSVASAVSPESDSESAFPFFKAYKTDTFELWCHGPFHLRTIRSFILAQLP